MIVNSHNIVLEEYWGSDLKVVNAARNSFDKRSDWDFDTDSIGVAGYRLKEKDERLIQYLARHKHELPFGHCGATLVVQVPIFLWRQLDRHRIGFNGNEAISEVSRRYVSDEPDFFIPKRWRQQAADKKQGSGIPVNDWVNAWATTELELFVKQSTQLYNDLLCDNVCEEQARMVLPQNMMTQIWWTGSLLGWSRLHNLRAAPDAQREAKDFAVDVGDIMRDLYPISWAALTVDAFKVQ